MRHHIQQKPLWKPGRTVPGGVTCPARPQLQAGADSIAPTRRTVRQAAMARCSELVRAQLMAPSGRAACAVVDVHARQYCRKGS